MITFLTLLFKISLCTAAFYLPYYFLLSRKTFFTINRIYLLCGIVFSFILPFISIETTVESYPVLLQSFDGAVASNSQLNDTSIASSISTNGLLTLTLLIAYLIGFSIQAYRLFRSIKKIIMLRYKGDKQTLDGYSVVKIDSNEIFSFFNTIFLPKSEIPPHILLHEKVHIQQHHWIDLLILEVVSVVLWFNPLLIFYRQSIKLQHEYQADIETISKGVSIVEYADCLVTQSNPIKNMKLISPFYFHSIKKRIDMLTQEKTRLRASPLYLILLPIICLILFAFSSKRIYVPHDPESGDTLVRIDSVVQHELNFVLPIANKNSKVSSGFGERMHPFYGAKRLHTGIDIIAEEGVNVIAMEDGVVVESTFKEAWGNIIVIKHDDTFSTSYSHLKERTVEKGDKVKRAQLIGLVGNTGLSTKSHLHFEIQKDGTAIDPASYLPKEEN